METKVDHFAEKSKTWDMNSKRVQNAQGIAELIVNNIKLDKSMELMDFGAGTGLLSYFVAPYVEKIVAVDNSPSMLREFQSKCGQFSCNTEVIEKDLSTDTLERKFDGIISSMTIHHLEDIPALFSKFYKMLDEHGFIAIADLDSEDGTFHSDNEGVFHYGFDRHLLAEYAQKAGFKDVTFSLANKISKPHAEFTVFLMTAKK
ncbi:MULTISPECIES: class I SAM-dependent methyltransferase [Sulfurovum]|uniref:Class I SAM-dependent methyltransferase n=1 Tax=Sulfurovum xiamenensis TaxID=3019066 RepID=A0ABT7QSC9_9BACT|nr:MULTISPECIES: class I SAM-dependent methyltransferase [Sulfurovum]EIF51698.1 methyltransferase [Sulfurovum sp. AR]MDM5263464.1 class I SAM-dependent methyltransferase [Sulfurovum xiamenensis]